MSAVRKVEVAGEHGYSIEIGSGLLGDGARLAHPLRGRHALIVSDGNVAPLYLQALLATLGAARPQLSRLPARMHVRMHAVLPTDLAAPGSRL